MLSCKEATQLFSEGLDRELSFWQQMNLRFHVLMCRACARYTRQVQALDVAVSEHYRGDPSVQKPERLADNALNRIKAALRFSKPNSDSKQAE